jgi:hypothetical protein
MFYFNRKTESSKIHYFRLWLRHYATNRKVAGSIPDDVIFLNLPNPSGRTRPWGLLSL